METKFTKGEWYITEEMETEIHSKRFPAGIDIICTIHNQFLIEQTDANAKLIAAAPDLFDACVSIIKWADELGYVNDFTKVRLALKKATE